MIIQSSKQSSNDYPSNNYPIKQRLSNQAMIIQSSKDDPTKQRLSNQAMIIQSSNDYAVVGFLKD